MIQMEDQNHESPVEELFEKADSYVHTTIELFKLKAIHLSSEVASSLIVGLFFSIGILFTFMVLSISLALWLGAVLGAPMYGFLALGLAYSFLNLVLFLLRDSWIKKPISNSIIRMMLPAKPE